MNDSGRARKTIAGGHPDDNPRRAEVDRAADGSRSFAMVDHAAGAVDEPRKAFANGPDAREAAAMLEVALRLPPAVTICAQFEPHAIRRVDYRFTSRDSS
jgi:hypothetical protein